MGNESRDARRSVSECFYGAVTVGERGQVVIPADARAHYEIKPGDKLLMMGHPSYDGLMLVKLEHMREFLDEFSRTLESMESQEDGA